MVAAPHVQIADFFADSQHKVSDQLPGPRCNLLSGRPVDTGQSFISCNAHVIQALSIPDVLSRSVQHVFRKSAETRSRGGRKPTERLFEVFEAYDSVSVVGEALVLLFPLPLTGKVTSCSHFMPRTGRRRSRGGGVNVASVIGLPGLLQQSRVWEALLLDCLLPP